MAKTVGDRLYIFSIQVKDTTPDKKTLISSNDLDYIPFKTNEGTKLVSLPQCFTNLKKAYALFEEYYKAIGTPEEHFKSLYYDKVRQMVHDPKYGKFTGKLEKEISDDSGNIKMLRNIMATIHLVTLA